MEAASDSVDSLRSVAATVEAASIGSSSYGNPTKHQLLLNAIKNQKIGCGDMVHAVPSTFFKQLEKTVGFGAPISPIINCTDLRDRLNPLGVDVKNGLIAADLEDPTGFIVLNATAFKTLKDSGFYFFPREVSLAQYPVVAPATTSSTAPLFTIAEIDVEPVLLRLYPVPSTTNESDPYTSIHASASWTLEVLTNVIQRVTDSKYKVKVWDITSDGAAFDSTNGREILEPNAVLESLTPINGKQENRSDRVFAVGVEITQELHIVNDDEEFPDSSTFVGLNGAKRNTESGRPSVSFEIKESLEQKRARIAKMQSGVFDNDSDSENKPRLLLGAADPSDSSITRIPASDSAFPGAGRTLGSSSNAVPVAPRVVPTKPAGTPGAVGLNNLGNTCFMNSALQCLSNSAHLTSFFLSDQWKAELNVDNPLGMNGEVARAYAGLVRQLWNPNPDASTDSYRGNSSVAPRNFKSTIGRFNQTFLGYSQQDSQELLQFLLDGLHEDLNRILKKPYVEQPDMDGRPDEEIATKSWEIYRMRNDSQIVDLFQGEYKSRVECLDCGRWSVKFDPYMFLSLPVPERREVSVTVIVVGSCFAKREAPGVAMKKENSLLTAAGRLAVNEEAVDANLSRSSSNASLLLPSDEESIRRYEQPKKMSFLMPRDATFLMLKQKIADKMGWKLSKNRRLVVSEVFAGKVYKSYQDWDRISDIQPADVIYVHEVVDASEWEDQERGVQPASTKMTYVPVYFSIFDEKADENRHVYIKPTPKLFGVPILVPVPAEVKVSATVQPEAAPHVSEELWREVLASRVGAVVYDLVIKSLGRYSKIGLYHSTAPSADAMDEDGAPSASAESFLSGPELIEEYIENARRPKWTPGQPPVAPIPPSSFYEEGVATISPNTAATAAVPIPSEQPKPVDPRTNGLFDHLLSGYDSSTQKTSVKNLFNLKYFQGESDVGMNSKDQFYNSHGGYRTLTKYFDLGADGVNAKVYRRKKKNTVTVVPMQEDRAEGEIDAVSPPEEEEDEILIASVDENTRTLEFNGWLPDSHSNQYSVRHVSLAEGGLGKNGSAEPYTDMLRMDGELVVHAEFSKEAAAMIFGEDVLETYRGVPAAFEAAEDLTSPSHGGKMNAAANSVKKQILLDDCLKEFMKEEIMGDDDTWYCPKCKEHKKIKKKLDIWSVPDVLVLHLKRFSQTGRGFRSMSSNKIDALVDFPVSGLDLSEFVIGREWMKQQESKAASEESGDLDEDDGKLLYDLFGVSNHFGGMGGGHYTAYAKNSLDETWYNFDDSHVSKLADANSVVTPAAYMLFYQRRTKRNPHKLNEMIELRKNAPPEPEKPAYASTSDFYKTPSYGAPIGRSPYSPLYSSVNYNNLHSTSPTSSVGTAAKSDDEEIGPKLPSTYSTIQSTAGYEFGLYKKDGDSPVHDINLDDEDGMPGLVDQPSTLSDNKHDTEDYDMFKD
ncbi:CSN-associated deubiquitinating enzyme Ubp12 [Rhizoclosmatium sp. JEL0117]|nr:CSN-associated deubiquitinating enzyme Ubp12 [Rhizoclosmatium sp. JEL0117]